MVSIDQPRLEYIVSSRIRVILVYTALDLQKLGHAAGAVYTSITLILLLSCGENISSRTSHTSKFARVEQYNTIRDAFPFSHSGFTVWISQTVYCYF